MTELKEEKLSVFQKEGSYADNVKAFFPSDIAKAMLDEDSYTLRPSNVLPPTLEEKEVYLYLEEQQVVCALKGKDENSPQTFKFTQLTFEKKDLHIVNNIKKHLQEGSSLSLQEEKFIFDFLRAEQVYVGQNVTGLAIRENNISTDLKGRLRIVFDPKKISFEDFKKALKVVTGKDLHYRQGRFNATDTPKRLFDAKVGSIMTLSDNTQRRKSVCDDQKGYQNNIKEIENSIDKYRSCKEVSFAYFSDDKPPVACAFSLRTTDDGKSWALETISNTTAIPKERRTFTLCTNDLKPSHQKAEEKETHGTPLNQLDSSIQSNIHSEDVRKLLKGIIRSDGTANRGMVTYLAEKLKANQHLDPIISRQDIDRNEVLFRFFESPKRETYIRLKFLERFKAILESDELRQQAILDTTFLKKKIEGRFKHISFLRARGDNQEVKDVETGKSTYISTYYPLTLADKEEIEGLLIGDQYSTFGEESGFDSGWKAITSQQDLTTQSEEKSDKQPKECHLMVSGRMDYSLACGINTTLKNHILINSAACFVTDELLTKDLAGCSACAFSGEDSSAKDMFVLDAKYASDFAQEGRVSLKALFNEWITDGRLDKNGKWFEEVTGAPSESFQSLLSTEIGRLKIELEDDEPLLLESENVRKAIQKETARENVRITKIQQKVSEMSCSGKLQVDPRYVHDFWRILSKGEQFQIFQTDEDSQQKFNSFCRGVAILVKTGEENSEYTEKQHDAFIKPLLLQGANPHSIIDAKSLAAGIISRIKELHKIKKLDLNVEKFCTKLETYVCSQELLKYLLPRDSTTKAEISRLVGDMVASMLRVDPSLAKWDWATGGNDISNFEIIFFDFFKIAKIMVEISPLQDKEKEVNNYFFASMVGEYAAKNRDKLSKNGLMTLLKDEKILSNDRLEEANPLYDFDTRKKWVDDERRKISQIQAKRQSQMKHSNYLTWFFEAALAASAIFLVFISQVLSNIPLNFLLPGAGLILLFFMIGTGRGGKLKSFSLGLSVVLGLALTVWLAFFTQNSLLPVFIFNPAALFVLGVVLAYTVYRYCKKLKGSEIARQWKSARIIALAAIIMLVAARIILQGVFPYFSEIFLGIFSGFALLGFVAIIPLGMLGLKYCKSVNNQPDADYEQLKTIGVCLVIGIILLHISLASLAPLLQGFSYSVPVLQWLTLGFSGVAFLAIIPLVILGIRYCKAVKNDPDKRSKQLKAVGACLGIGIILLSAFFIALAPFSFAGGLSIFVFPDVSTMVITTKICAVLAMVASTGYLFYKFVKDRQWKAQKRLVKELIDDHTTAESLDPPSFNTESSPSISWKLSETPTEEQKNVVGTPSGSIGSISTSEKHSQFSAPNCGGDTRHVPSVSDNILNNLNLGTTSEEQPVAASDAPTATLAEGASNPHPRGSLVSQESFHTGRSGGNSSLPDTPPISDDESNGEFDDPVTPPFSTASQAKSNVSANKTGFFIIKENPNAANMQASTSALTT